MARPLNMLNVVSMLDLVGVVALAAENRDPF